MALGRPVNKDTQHKVIVHTLCKHRYASTKVFTVGKDGKIRYSYKHWGTLDESNRFHPGVNYFYATTDECDKLIFPADWDMSGLSELSSTRRRGCVSPETNSALSTPPRYRLLGSTLLTSDGARTRNTCH